MTLKRATHMATFAVAGGGAGAPGGGPPPGLNTLNLFLDSSDEEDDEDEKARADLLNLSCASSFVHWVYVVSCVLTRSCDPFASIHEYICTGCLVVCVCLPFFFAHMCTYDTHSSCARTCDLFNTSAKQY